MLNITDMTGPGGKNGPKTAKNAKISRLRQKIHLPDNFFQKKLLDP